LAHFIVNVHIPVGCDWFYHRKKLVEGEENIFCIPKVNFSIISYGNCISNTVTELKLKTYGECDIWLIFTCWQDSHIAFIYRRLWISHWGMFFLWYITHSSFICISENYFEHITTLSLHWQYISLKSWIQVDLSSNLLTELPEAFGKLYNLKVCGTVTLAICKKYLPSKKYLIANLKWRAEVT